MRRDAAPAEEDRTAPRREAAADIATSLRQAFDKYARVDERGTQDGPLGGQFELVMVDLPTPHGMRRVRVCVYGMGVMADDENPTRGRFIPGSGWLSDFSDVDRRGSANG